MNEQSETKPDHHVEVIVVTTSGLFPPSGSDRLASNQPVKNQLKKAVKELHIVDTTNWVATVGGTQIDPDKSYTENGLSGLVSIDYGPSHGGGGVE